MITRIFLTIFTFIVLVPGLKVWELAGEVSGKIVRSVRLRHARILEKRAYCLESEALILKNKADKIIRTTN